MIIKLLAVFCAMMSVQMAVLCLWHFERNKKVLTIVMVFIFFIFTLIVIPMVYGADSVYVLSGDALVTIDEQKVTVPAFAAELKIQSYFKCGEYDGKSIYNVPCVGNTCAKLRKSIYFISDKMPDPATTEIGKEIAIVTYEVIEKDADGKDVKVQKREKFKKWKDKGEPPTFKRIDPPVIWQ